MTDESKKLNIAESVFAEAMVDMEVRMWQVLEDKLLPRLRRFVTQGDLVPPRVQKHAIKLEDRVNNALHGPTVAALHESIRNGTYDPKKDESPAPLMREIEEWLWEHEPWLWHAERLYKVEWAKNVAMPGERGPVIP